jgi:hypothetical protein
MGAFVGRLAWTLAFAAFSLIGSANNFGRPPWRMVLRSGELSEVSQPNFTGDWGDCGLISSAMAHLRAQSSDAIREMTSPLTPVPSTEPGVYAFKTDLSMTSRWLLRIAAMVPGER